MFFRKPKPQPPHQKPLLTEQQILNVRFLSIFMDTMPLSGPARAEKMETLQKLLAQGAKPDGVTLILAASYKDAEMSRFVILHGVDEKWSLCQEAHRRNPREDLSTFKFMVGQLFHPDLWRGKEHRELEARKDQYIDAIRIDKDFLAPNAPPITARIEEAIGYLEAGVHNCRRLLLQDHPLKFCTPKNGPRPL